MRQRRPSGETSIDLVATSDEVRAEAEKQTHEGMEGERHHRITRRTRKDGTFVDVEMFGAPVIVADETVGLYAMYHDISELQRQRRYFEALVAVSPVAVVLVDTENIVTSWNPAAERWFGYTADQAIRQYVVGLVAKEPSLVEDAEVNSGKVRQGSA